jgi:isoquinoline 1-oxidoreductase beta subunit
MSRLGTIARRSFLIGSAAIAGGVVFGWWKYATPYPNPLERDLAQGAVTLTPYVLIDQSGVTLIAPRAEMGQGIHSTLAALLAEELDLAWDQVRVIHGPASDAYFNGAILEESIPFAMTNTSWLAETMRNATHIPTKFLGFQLTGGSSSTPDAFDKMRLAGAAARAALLGAAAKHLGVDAATLSTNGGAVIAPDGKRLPYAEIAVAAASVPLPEAPALKPKSDWRLLGKSLPRTDMLGKVTGTAQFATDIRLPGMLFASVRTNPGIGGAMTGYDATEAEAMTGVERIVPVENGVAVVATNTWTAMQALDAITFDWAPAPYPATSAEMQAALAAAFTPAMRDSRLRNDGDVEAALTGEVFEAEYHVPYLAHATMEPMAAAALLKDGRLTVWAGHQFPTMIRTEGERLTGLVPEAIDVNTLVMGGGFGRRAETDFIRQAITIAKAMEGTPVLLTWSREEDMTHDGYRPMAAARVRATVRDGMVSAMDLSLAATSVVESQVGRLGWSVPGPDATIVQAAWDQPYGFPNCRVTGYRPPVMAPVGIWRSVGASQNAFFVDSAIDELAHLAGIDPLLFRIRQMTHTPSIKVMEAVAEMSGWGATPAGRARGVAFCLSFAVPCAQVIEVENTPEGIRLTNAWAAVDVGTALDPRNIEAQVSGAMIFGLSAAIRGEITFDAGKAQQTNFWDYEPLRLRETPPIAVRILENGEKIRGIGEPGTPPAAPALANAIFALTGQRIRDLPMSKLVTFA